MLINNCPLLNEADLLLLVIMWIIRVLLLLPCHSMAHVLLMWLLSCVFVILIMMWWYSAVWGSGSCNVHVSWTRWLPVYIYMCVYKRVCRRRYYMSNSAWEWLIQKHDFMLFFNFMLLMNSVCLNVCMEHHQKKILWVGVHFYVTWRINILALLYSFMLCKRWHKRANASATLAIHRKIIKHVLQ